MALNNSGPISLGGSTTGQSIALELGQSATGQISLNDANVRALAQVPSGAIIMPTNFYNKGAGYGGTIISYSLGGGGAGGIDAQNGAAGQNSTLTYSSVTLIAYGGGGGNWNNSVNGSGGSASGVPGSSDAVGGTGGGVSGDRGGGGGGGIGTSDNNTWGQSAGQTGASAIDWTGTLSAALSGTGYSLGFGGAGASSSSSSINNMNGSPGGDIGAGGGGAGYYGGNGGPGGLGGGGGGGAAGYTAPDMTGGSGGVGMLLVQSFNGSSYTKAIFFGPTSATYTLPNGTISFQVWLIGGGGGGAGSAGYDGNSGGGGGAGGATYRGWF